MKYHKGWNYSVYRPPFIEVGEIYINRLVPYENSAFFEWSSVQGKKEIFYRVLGETEWIKAGKTEENSFEIKDLLVETDYEFFVSLGEKKSRVRLFRTGKSVGTVVNYLHPKDEAYAFSGRYLASPSIIRTPQGHLLASMDLYAQGAPQNLTLIYRSDDDGKTWKHLCELFPCFWGKLFVHHGEIYMISESTEYGDLLIGKSLDGGSTWSDPVILLRGSNGKKGFAGPHKAPMPILEFNGRLWTAMEWGAWGSGYHAPMVASVPADSDLLNPENWSFANPIKYDENWQGVPKGPSTGSIEGSIVEKDGELYNIMRYDMTKLERRYGLALRFKLDKDDPEAQLTYDGVIEFSANASKFSIIWDKKTKRYYTIANLLGENMEVNHGTGFGRNHLCLMYSENLEEWKVASSILDYRHADPNYTGFQYVDFFFEGDDILFLCRTAINGANNFHDSNYCTFHRIKNFRNL